MFQIKSNNKKLGCAFIVTIILCGLFLSACGEKSGSSTSPGVKPPNNLVGPEPEELTPTSGDRQVKLSWEGSSADEVDEFEITGYEYQRSETADGFDDTWISIPGGERTREVIISGLTDRATYYFRLRAVNSEGTEMPSTEVSALAYDGLTAEPSASPALAAVPGDSQVTLSWNVPPTVGASAIIGYEYQQSLTSGGFDDEGTWVAVLGEEGVREVIVSGLSNGTAYYFRVRALNTEGKGSPSTEVSALPSGRLASQSEAPISLAGIPGDRQVTLSWAAPPFTGSSDITHYEYQKSTTSGDFSGELWTPISGGDMVREAIVSGLTGGTNYYFRLRAVNGEGGGVFAELSTTPREGLTVKPSPPTALIAIPGDRQVTLNWEAPELTGTSEVIGYEYQQSLTKDGFNDTWLTVPRRESADEESADGESFREVVVSHLMAGTIYYFQVRAVNGHGAGESSSEISALPSDGLTRAEPGPPIDLAATSGDSQVTLSWNPPRAVGTSEITGYEYQYRLARDEFGEIWTSISGGGTASEVIISGLTGAARYSFRLRAVNAQGSGSFAEISAVSYEGLFSHPGIPTNLSSTSGDHQVTLSWAAPDTIGASEIIRYEYRYSLATEEFNDTWFTVSGGEGTRGVVISGLEGATTYRFQLRSVNLQGSGDSTQVMEESYDGAIAEPGVPAALVATSGDSQVTLNWGSPLTVGASEVTGYEYQKSLTIGDFSGSTWTSISGGESVREVIVSGLNEATTYYFRLRAVNTQGYGDFAEISAIAYDGLTAEPGPPTALISTPGDLQVTLNWNPPLTIGASEVTGYEYQQSLTSGDFSGVTWISISGGASAREVIISGLEGATAYYFQLRAVNAQGGGSFPEISAVAYDGATAEPGPPTALTSTSGDSQVTLNWEAPSITGTSQVIGYEYQYSLTSGNSNGALWISVSGGASVREVVVSGLNGATIYYFRLRAVNTQGGGSFVELSAVPHDGPTAEPGSPTALTSTSGDSQVTLNWGAPDTVGASEVTGYKYQYSLTSGDFSEAAWTFVSGGASAREVVVLGLNGATTYYFRLRAVNVQGGGSFTEISAVPYDGPTAEPGSPTALTATGGGFQVTLNWEAPGTIGASEVTGYEYQYSLTSGDFSGSTWTSISGGASAREVVVSGLNGATTYYFRLRAVNVQGGGSFTEISAVPYDGPTAEPGSPTALTATGGGFQVTLNWEAPGTIGASEVTGYEYQYSLTSGDFSGSTWTSISGGASAREVVVSGLNGATTYYFRLRAMNAQGYGDFAEISAIVYDPTGLPGVPTDLVSTAGDRLVTLSWEAPDTIGASEVTGYEYQQSLISGDFNGSTWTSISGDGDARKTVISGLEGGTTYYFQLRAVNAQGAMVVSVEVSALPDDTSEDDLAICSDSGTTADALPGAGTEEDPFVLCIPEHLSLIGDTDTDSTYTMSAYYVMGQSIDLNNVTFTPIIGHFSGTFDGRGERIRNLKIHRESNWGGLFTRLVSGGTIKNLGIENFDVTGHSRVGVLVAKSSGLITNCYAVDWDDYDSEDVSGQSDEDSVGGLVGEQSGGDIISSYATGEVHGGSDKDNVGGLVGRQSGGKIIASYATGDIYGGSYEDNVGGLVGRQSGGDIISSYATGDIHGGSYDDNVGGFVGQQSGGDIISSYAQGKFMAIYIGTMWVALWGNSQMVKLLRVMPQGKFVEEGRVTL